MACADPDTCLGRGRLSTPPFLSTCRHRRATAPRTAHYAPHTYHERLHSPPPTHGTRTYTHCCHAHTAPCLAARRAPSGAQRTDTDASSARALTLLILRCCRSTARALSRCCRARAATCTPHCHVQHAPHAHVYRGLHYRYASIAKTLPRNTRRRTPHHPFPAPAPPPPTTPSPTTTLHLELMNVGSAFIQGKQDYWDRWDSGFTVQDSGHYNSYLISMTWTPLYDTARA